MRKGLLTKLFEGVRRTPLHPQWLMGGRRQMAQWIAEHAVGRTLDVGCADRWIEGHLPAGSAYLGLDYPPTGQKMYGARPDVFADASKLPIADMSIDTVVILEVLEHLRLPQEALKEIARVLRPNGGLLLSVPFLYPIHDAPHDYQRLTAFGLARDVEAVGLSVDSLEPVLGSIETAGLLVCLAIGGTILRAFQARHPAVVLVPLALIAIPLINVCAWLFGRLLPTWDAITVGYRIRASKSPRG